MRAVAVYVYAILLAVALIMALTTEAKAGESERAYLEALITKEAAKQGFDADLVIAIVEVESGFNKKAVGALNEQGLFQLRPEYHDLGDGSVEANIRAGVRYLAHLRASAADRETASWVLAYNRGPYAPRLKKPEEATYYKKVITLYHARKASKQTSNLQVVPHVGR